VVLLLLLPVALAIGLRARQAGNTVDDAYITYRYAANLAAGQGLVYNPGERVLGTTSPAYALLLGSMAFFAGAGALPTISLALNAAMDGLLVVLLFFLVSRMTGGGLAGGAAGLTAALLYAVDAKSVDFSTGGMESPVFVACVLVTVWLSGKRRYREAAWVAALSVAVRPDGGLLLAVTLGVAWLWGRRFPWRPLLESAALVAAMAGIAWFYYGDPLPASVRAKAGGVYLLPDDHALRYLCRHVAGMAWPRIPAGRILPGLPGAAREYATLLASSLLPLGLMLAGWRSGRRILGPAADLLAAYAGLFFITFALANPFMMGWYYVPLETAYIALLALGAAGFGSLVARHGGFLHLAPDHRRAIGVGFILALLLIPQLQRYQWLPTAGRGVATLFSEWEKIREQDYLQVAGDLDRLTGGEARVAGPEIGALGFAYSGAILDTVGLVSPVARPYYPLDRSMVAGNSGVPPDLIAAEQPDLVVLLEIFGRRGLLVDSRFQRDYRLWRTYPSRVFGSRGLLVFVRRSAVW
jgi:hypothetical protein